MTKVQIIVTNVYTEVKNASKEIESKIYHELAFEIQDFNPAGGFKPPRIHHLYSRKNKLTYTGLLKHLIEILDENEVEYKIIDKREKPEQNADFHFVPFLDKEGKIPLKKRDYQQEIIDKCEDREVIQAATGAGKALFVDTPILTPNGFVKMKDIHINDIVYDENGMPTKVIGEFPQGVKDAYKVEFQDGTSVICDIEHLWKYTTRARQFNLDNCKVETLQEILNNKLTSSRNAYKFAIPINKSIQFEKKDLFLPPYLLGLLLGDGSWTTNAITFTNTEKDVINNLKLLSENFGTWELYPGHSNIQYVFENKESDKRGQNEFRNYIHSTFNHCKSTDKFVPKEYLYSSIEDRLELVRGLIDTDGNVNEKGHIRFCTVSKQLADDFVFLVRSLGYRTFMKLDNRKENVAYCIYISNCDDSLFSSKKHKENFTNRTLHKNHRYDILKITNIEKLDYQVEMKCIAVDSSAHTYICSDFIVTHNTLIMAGLVEKFNVKPVAIIADKIALCQQLRDEFQKFLGVPVGLVGGGQKDIKDITVYSAQSVTEEDIKPTQLLLCDECFTYDTEVTLANGKKEKIGVLVENYNKNKPPYVLSYNIYENKCEPKAIIHVSTTLLNLPKIMKLTIMAGQEKRIITCTQTHRFYVRGKGYIFAKDLKENEDRVLFSVLKEPAIKTVTRSAKVINKEFMLLEKPYVYDLEIADNHNFFANDILVSNCHHVPAETISQVARWCENAYYRVGVSATPWRDDGSDLLIDAAFAKRKPDMAINASYLIERGYLVPCTIYWVYMRTVVNGKNFQQVYNQAIVRNQERNEAIISIAYNMLKYKNACELILIQRIEHGERIYNMLLDYIELETYPMHVKDNSGKDRVVLCHNIELLTGDDDSIKRNAVLQAAREKKCRILIASTIFDEGIDVASLDTLILAGGGKSSTRAFQRIGRVLRLYTDPITGKKKERATVFDFCDFTKILRRHARARDKMYAQEPAWDIKNFPDHLLQLPPKLKK